MSQVALWVKNIVGMSGLTGSALDSASSLAMAFVVLCLAVLSFYVCHKLIVPLMVAITEKTEVEWDDILLNKATLRSACHVVPVVLLWLFIPDIFASNHAVAVVVSRILAICIVVASMRLGITFIDSFKGFEGERRTALQQYFHTFCGILKIAVIFIAVIIMVSIALGRSPLTLLAGLGATSAILMLVFKDAITGLVAGVRLTSNDMLHKGDWITVPKAGANGFVEDMTLTTVKVRNFDNTIVTVSPNTLVSDSFQNWSGMWKGGGRRVKRAVYIDFRSISVADDNLKERLSRKGYFKPKEMEGDAVNLTLFRRYIERWVASRDDVNDEMLFMVRQLEATETGLPVEIYFFLKQKQWKPYEHHLAEVMEYVYAVIPDFGLKIYQRYSDK